MSRKTPKDTKWENMFYPFTALKTSASETDTSKCVICNAKTKVFVPYLEKAIHSGIMCGVQPEWHLNYYLLEQFPW